ncbi:MAG TPA: hypothetical protein V6D18_09575 [Thermosynechococcaceae cyanobacterium]
MQRTNLDQSFDRLIASFHGIPRAEFRRLHRVWLVEKTQQEIGGGES